MTSDEIPIEPGREPRPRRPTLPQEKFGIQRQHWLPLLAFAGGSLVFIIVDLVCLALSRMAHPAASALSGSLPR